MSVVEKFRTMEYGPAPEDPKESLVWLDHHHRKFGHFIDGAWRTPAEGKYFETADPSAGTLLGTGAQGNAADIDAAGKSGWKAWPRGPTRPPPPPAPALCPPARPRAHTTPQPCRP